MRCEEVKSLLARGLEEGFDLRESAALQDHVAGCDACRVEHDRLLAFFSALDGGPEPVPPAGFKDRVMACVRAEPRAADGFFPSLVQLGFAVLTVVAVGVAIVSLGDATGTDVFGRTFLLQASELYRHLAGMGALVGAGPGTVATAASLATLAVLVAVNIYIGLRVGGSDRGGAHGA